ncbi:hypothetical protein CDD82_6943 [Ophiocordyceps australis]|uniref:Spindle pole body component n=1 Tax=Ophiocordyceps australis TaxID=1399860 RepID=A0A2C5Y2J8_9HYPO|nr:hypothetical protein CDD82_6943 [Ophiocordyceps australis]
MAFAARLGPLTEELIEASTQLTAQNSPSRFRAVRDATLAKLKCHQFLDTNPFQVLDNLRGLDERFRVNHRDGLADALLQRLDALEQQSLKWRCEILQVLLELSDQPTFKTRLSHVEALQQPAQDDPVELRLEEMAKEEGWDRQEGIWRTISYSDDSTDDSADDSADEERDSRSVAASHATSDTGQGPPDSALQQVIIHSEDYETLQLVQQAQEWRRSNQGKINVPEEHVIREVLFMLQGYDCTVFDESKCPNPSYQLANVSWETYRRIMDTFGEYGRKLGVLREFADKRHGVPHIQTLSHGVSARLAQLDGNLSAVEARFAAPREQVVVSLIALADQVAPWLEPLVALSSIIGQVHDTETFGHLELLFDATCTAQVSSTGETFEFLARCFIECFNVYIVPIRCWMDEGKQLASHELLLIKEASGEVPLGDTWERRFEMCSTDTMAGAPRFLRGAVVDIYNAGKNVVVLRMLGKHGAVDLKGADLKGVDLKGEEPALSYEAICQRGLELAPFADVFGAAFDGWIQSKYGKTSTTLKRTLIDDWGLATMLDALQTLYLMADGSAAASLCDDVFDRIDGATAKTNWHDGYGLTAAAQRAFAACEAVDTSRLSVSVDAAGRALGAAGRASVQAVLPHVRLDYRLPWPVQMIVRRQSLQGYQAVFTLQLQVRRAMRALQRTWTHGSPTAPAGFYSARTRLVWFCTTLQTYLTAMVLEPGAVQMRRDVAAAADVDAMVGAHREAVLLMVDKACLGQGLEAIRHQVLAVLDLALVLDARADEAATELWEEIKAEMETRVAAVQRGLLKAARARSGLASASWQVFADMLDRCTE